MKLEKEPSAPSLPYCTARYLDQCLQRESDLHNKLQGSTGAGVREALSYFGVVRGFEGISDTGRADEAVRIFRLWSHPSSKRLPTTRVVRLAEAFEAEFGAYTLSAASKLLWLRHLDPFVIFDSRCERALRNPRFGLPADSTYAVYVDCWRAAFQTYKKHITAALRDLSTLLPYTYVAYKGQHGETLIRKAAKQTWFEERVFDQYLWQIGIKRQG